MGFTTGFLGGATLTYSVLYLGLYLHRSNRSIQHTLLRQQSTLLNSVIEPLPPAPEPPAYSVQTVSLTETLKDRWNGEIEGLVRRAQQTDWSSVRERWEERIGVVWAKMRNTEAADRFRENVVGTESGAEGQGVKNEGEGSVGKRPKRLLELDS